MVSLARIDSLPSKRICAIGPLKGRAEARLYQ